MHSKKTTKTKSEHTKTKHELATSYGISLRTVYRTLQLAGLSTRKRFYTREEEFLFGLTRYFLNLGYTSTQIPLALQEFFNQKQVFPYEQERITPSPKARSQY